MATPQNKSNLTYTELEYPAFAISTQSIPRLKSLLIQQQRPLRKLNVIPKQANKYPLANFT
jgi:hypothetical protein